LLYTTSILLLFFFSLVHRPPPRATLFPYTTLFRSLRLHRRAWQSVEDSLPVTQTLGILKRDLQGIVPPSGVLGGTIPCRSRLRIDRKSTRLNSSHDQISYAVFCLKKKKKQNF